MRINKTLISLLRDINHINKKIVYCHICGDATLRKPSKIYQLCSIECELIHNNNAYIHNKIIRKRYKTTAQYKKIHRIHKAHAERIDPIQIFNRDKWICQICGLKTLPSLRGKHLDRSPELDHIVPLSRGGNHTYGNVQCACRKCNISKGNGAYGQLRIAI